MEDLRDHFKSSLANSLLSGLVLATLIPLGVVPFTRFLKRRKRSINQHLEYKNKTKKPDDFNFVVTRTITLSGLATGLYLHLAANSDKVLWSFAEATPFFLLKTFVGCVVLRDILQYGKKSLTKHSLFICLQSCNLKPPFLFLSLFYYGCHYKGYIDPCIQNFYTRDFMQGTML